MPKGSSDSGFFGVDAFRFLRELGKNNNREWFQTNKGRYEAAIQEPAVRFIASMGPRLARLAPHVVADPRPFGGSLSRIYRDTRFSKDKSPYKTHVGIHFAHEDGASSGRNLPGFFFHLAPSESMVASGIWHPVPPDLVQIRDAIVADSTGWGKVLKGQIEIGGESYVRVPAGYDAGHPYADDLRRKDFYASRPFPDAAVVSGGFASKFEAACRELNPLNQFLADALGVPL
ncbi:MAG TPA: DUF2461 domain-containing protein [Thermoplasmata archaeon]|nr:DUF2461 domain-containing protein [Thermoplasmata archaeon]